MINMPTQNKIIFILVFFLLSCEGSKNNDDVVLARVGKKKLFFKDLPTQLNGPNIKKNDVSVFVNSWVNDQVLFISAEKEGFLNDRVLKERTEKYYKDIVISSFVETKTNIINKITKEDVLSYYNNNKLSFIRKRDGVFARHFVLEDLNLAKKIKVQLSKTKRSVNVDQYLNDTSYIREGLLSKDLNELLFNSNTSIIGPVLYNKKHHVFEIVSRYKKGSLYGLEEVHDEVYQRLMKKVSIGGTSRLLDSLKRKNDVFINLNY